MEDNSKTFKLDDPVCIKGEVTKERAQEIIARLNQEMQRERELMANTWTPKVYYR